MSNPTYSNVIPAPPDLIPLVNERGVCTTAWYRFFLTLFQRTGGGGGDIIPSDLAVLSIMDDSDAQQTLNAIIASLAASAPQDPNPLSLSQVLATSTPQDQQAFLALATSMLAAASAAPSADPILPAYLATAQDPTQQDPMALALLAATEDELGGPLPVVGVTLGASPATWTALTDGSLILTGGTVNTIEVSRDAGATYIDTGLTTGMIPVRRNDIVKVTYAVAPTAQNFLPG